MSDSPRQKPFAINEEKLVENIDDQLAALNLEHSNKETKWIFLAKLKFNVIYLRNTFHEWLQRFPLLIYSLKRIFFALITLVLAVSVIFILLRVVTPDAVYLSDIDLAKLKITVGSPEYILLLTERMKIFGVYGSIWEQLGTYLKNVTPFIPKTINVNSVYDPATGSLVYETLRTWFYLGIVFSSSVSQPGDLVSHIFTRAMPYSFAFGSIALLFAYVIGIPVGIIAAKSKEKSLDHAINAGAITLLAIPPVVLVTGLYLITINVFHGHGLFSSGTLDTKIWPVVAIFLMVTPPIIMNTRRYVIDEMTSDYTKFALSKGMSNQYIFYVHIFRNAGIRVFRLLPAAFITTIFGASIFAEQNWSIPGMSKFIISGVSAKDSFVVMAYILLTAVAGIITSLLADIIMAVLDPRVKLTKH